MPYCPKCRRFNLLQQTRAYTCKSLYYFIRIIAERIKKLLPRFFLKLTTKPLCRSFIASIKYRSYGSSHFLSCDSSVVQISNLQQSSKDNEIAKTMMKLSKKWPARRRINRF